MRKFPLSLLLALAVVLSPALAAGTAHEPVSTQAKAVGVTVKRDAKVFGVAVKHTAIKIGHAARRFGLRVAAATKHGVHEYRAGTDARKTKPKKR
ncbi:MAG TPA: hypothetical protein VND80_02160 [Steroidobacteraceae bacterium]|nr:hypothetical protein [Steroidobacteraceae bacterium]